MENIDLTQKVAEDTSNYLGAGGIIIVSAIFVLMFIFFRRYRARIIPLLIGMVGYGLFIILGYNLIITLIFQIPGVETNYTNNPTVLTGIFLIIFVGLLTVARILFTNILFEKYNRPGDVLNFGLGLGVLDALITAFSTLTLTIWSIGINGRGLTELFKDFSSEEVVSYYNSISDLFTQPSIFWTLLGISTVIDLLLGCGLAVVIFGVVSKKISTWWYGVSVLMNFIVVLPFKLYSTTEMGVIIPFAIKMVIFVAVVFVIYRLDNDYIGGIISYNTKNHKSLMSKSMPKFGKLNKK